jgi:hypothetical protein
MGDPKANILSSSLTTDEYFYNMSSNKFYISVLGVVLPSKYF